MSWGIMDFLDPLGIFGGSKSSKYAQEAYQQALAAISNAAQQSSKYLEEGKSKAQSYLDAIDTSRKSAKQLYQEGREVAGTAAVDKAGLAKKQAKAASMQAGSGKLFAAIQGAQAATEAAQTGYDEAAQSAAQMAQSQENAQKGSEMTKAQNQANAEMSAAQQQAQNATTLGSAAAGAAQNYGNQRVTAEENKKNRMASLGSAFLGSLG